jgi:hypothetical protein
MDEFKSKPQNPQNLAPVLKGWRQFGQVVVIENAPILNRYDDNKL